MCHSSRCGRGRLFLLGPTIRRAITLLGITHETLDKIHVLCDDCLINTMRLEVTEEGNPRWVDASRCEAFLSIIAHVCDMNE